MRVKKAILAPGTYFVAGIDDSGHACQRAVEFTVADCREFARTGREMVRAGLAPPVPLDHQPDAKPLDRAGRLARTVTHNTGFVADYSVDDRGVLSAVLDVDAIPLDGKFVTDEAEIRRFLTRRVRSVSPEILPEFTDGNGRTWRNAITHIALTPAPVWHGQPAFGSDGVAMSRGSLARMTTERWGKIPVRLSLASCWYTAPALALAVSWGNWIGPATLAVAHAPKGGITIGGKHFPGGRFIPSADLAKATPEEKAKVDQARDQRQDKIKADVPEKPDHAGLREKLAAHVDRQLAKHEVSSAKRAFAGIRAYHGDLAMHRIHQLVHQDLEKHARAQGPEKERLAKRLRGYGHMLDWHKEQPEPSKYTGVHSAPIEDLHVDPERFQYKLGATKREGVVKEGSALEGVKRFRPEFAGVISVWRDPKNGKTYVVNGHHRHNLAKEAGEKNLNVLYINAKNDKEARAIGALANISEGRGTATDAAKLIREQGFTPEDFEKEGVSLKGAVASDAFTLSQLSDGLFKRLTLGTLDDKQALALGTIPDHGDQEQFAKWLDKQDRDIPDRVLGRMAEKIKNTKSVKKVEQTLFGDEESTENLFLHRATLETHVLAKLAAEANLFGAVGSERKAETLKRGKNVLDVEANKAIADDARRQRNLLAMLVDKKGPIADAFSKAAEELHGNARNRKAIEARLIEQVRELASRELAGSRAAPAAAGTEAPPGRAGGVERQEPAGKVMLEKAMPPAVPQAMPKTKGREKVMPAAARETPVEGPGMTAEERQRMEAIRREKQARGEKPARPDVAKPRPAQPRPDLSDEEILRQRKAVMEKRGVAMSRGESKDKPGQGTLFSRRRPAPEDIAFESATVIVTFDGRTFPVNLSRRKPGGFSEGAGSLFGGAAETWTRYQGPRGGQGWQSTKTGRVRYVQDMPGEHEHEGVSDTEEAPPGPGEAIWQRDLFGGPGGTMVAKQRKMFDEAPLPKPEKDRPDLPGQLHMFEAKTVPPEDVAFESPTVTVTHNGEVIPKSGGPAPAEDVQSTTPKEPDHAPERSAPAAERQGTGEADPGESSSEPAPKQSAESGGTGDDGGPDADSGGVGSRSDGGAAGTPRIITAREERVRPADPKLVPARLHEHMRPHAVQGAAQAIRAMDAEGGFLLADGTGTAKTSQQLAVAQKYADEGYKVLIVSPAEVVKPDWKKGTVTGSFADDGQRMGVKLALNNGETQLEPGKIHLSTYSNLSKLKDKIDGKTIVLWDESHYLKNWSSARSKNAFEMNKAAHATMYSTATPADKPMHIGHLFRAGVFGRGKWAETWEALGMHQVTINTPRGPVSKWEINPRVGAAEARRRLSGLFDKLADEGLMLKRELSMERVGVGFDHIDLPPEAEDTMRRVEESVTRDASGDNPGLLRARILMHQRRQLEPYKIPHTVAAAKQELAEGRQVVVFLSRVNESEVGGDDDDDESAPDVASEGTAKSLREALVAAGVSEAHIGELHGGATKTATAKKKAMEDFQAGKTKVMIATIESGGTGINLDDTTGDKPRTMLMMTAPFSAVPTVQALGRINRLNTKSDSRVRFMFSNMDVDKWNAGLIAKKLGTLHATIKGEVAKIKIPGMEEFEESGEPHEWTRPVGRGRVFGASSKQSPATATVMAPANVAKQDEPVAPVNREQKAAIHDALRQLHGANPDAATVRNNIGFNQMDSAFGGQLAEASEMTDSQAHAAAKMLAKYRRQLGSELADKITITTAKGESPPEVKTPPRAAIETRKVRTAKGERHVHSFEPGNKFWNAWRSSLKANKPSYLSVGKNPRSGDWEVSIWGASPDEVAESMSDLNRRLGTHMSRRIPPIPENLVFAASTHRVTLDGTIWLPTGKPGQWRAA